MPIDLEGDVRRQLTAYLQEQQSVDELDDWVSQLLPSIDGSPDLDGQALAHLVVHRLAEYSDDLWAEDELRDLLRSLLNIDTRSSGNTMAAAVVSVAVPGSSSMNVAAPAQVGFVESHFSLAGSTRS